MERADVFVFAAGKEEAGAKRTLRRRDIVGRFRFVLDACGNPPQSKRPGARLAPGPCLVVREMGVEPTLQRNWFLRPARLPFRHSRR